MRDGKEDLSQRPRQGGVNAELATPEAWDAEERERGHLNH